MFNGKYFKYWHSDIETEMLAVIKKTAPDSRSANVDYFDHDDIGISEGDALILDLEVIVHYGRRIN